MTISEAADSRINPWPTRITLVRLALAPIVGLLVFAAHQASLGHQRELAAGLAGSAAWLFALAGVSDILDGWLARRLQATSTLGAALDHASDKVLGLAAGVALIGTRLPFAAVLAVLVVLLRDAAIGGLREGLAQSGRAMPVGWIGKLKTAALFAGLAAALVWQWAGYASLAPAVLAPLLLAAEGGLFAAAAAALVSAVGYVRSLGDKPIPPQQN